jgi:two-component system, chemotaxis family, CheB/CheR fusion protein
MDGTMAELERLRGFMESTSAANREFAGEQAIRPNFVVGIGASAGGLEALESLFGLLPADTGMAFVVVQHLSPDFKSMMNELLSHHTRMPIYPVEDGIEVRPNSIYLIPPKKEMIISEGRLLLKDKEQRTGLNLPIDQFFRALAQDCRERAVGIILSGTGSDGSRGIRDIHAAGGLVIAQSEGSAKFDGMPRSALDTGVVDLVLPPEQIPAALQRHRLQSIAGTIGGDRLAIETDGDRGMNAIMGLLRREFGIDFSHYKPNTVVRRTERRLALAKVSDLASYVDRLSRDKQELNKLYKDLLIGVTCFFRDMEGFTALEKALTQKLESSLDTNEEFRIWVAGCATGEEAYSVAIMMDEISQRLRRPASMKIFATDVHPASLEFASAGVFSQDNLRGMTPQRLEQYFELIGDYYLISPELRKRIVFAPHNIIRDAPFTKLDVVTCRNLLIYLQPSAQRKALSLFHFGLKSSGILMLGPSETPLDLAEEFECLDETWRIYRKRRDVRLNNIIRLPLQNRLPYERSSSVPISTRSSKAPDLSLMSAYDGVLAEFVPPSLLVNENRELVHSFGRAEIYVMPRGGRVSRDILDQLDNELRIALAGAMQRATKEQLPVTLRGVPAVSREGTRIVDLSVRPIHNRHTNSWYSLIVFDEAKEAPVHSASPTTLRVDDVSLDRILSLEKELQLSKENLQATIEELETSNEELQAANEELIASNEELQSTNEELHSVNEELYTVNGEYQRKIAELTEMTSDMDNLLASTEIGTIFLDTNLCIRKFTPTVGRIFELLPQDIGRRIDAFSHSLNRDILADAHRVLETHSSVEYEVQDRKGQWYFLRILPYRAQDTVQGVVLTLIDITALKATRASLGETDRLLRAILHNSSTAVFVKDLRGKYILTNHHCEKKLGVSANEALGKSDEAFFDPETAAMIVKNDQLVARSGKVHRFEETIPVAGGSTRTFLSVKFPILAENGEIEGIGGIATDITQQKGAELEQRAKVRSRDLFLAMLSHELRGPLAAIVHASQILEGNAPADMHHKAKQIIARQSEQITRLLEDLLDVGRMTQGKWQLQRTTVDLRNIVRDAVEPVQHMYERQQHVFSIDLPSEPVWVVGDAARLQQVCVNLLTNAAKYTPAGGGKISVSLHHRENKAIIEVRDNGVGIAPEYIEFIFDMFAQADQTLARADGGMGVGLTLVKTIVELHQGSVVADSQGRGLGSKFVVEIPCVPSPPALGYRELHSQSALSSKTSTDRATHKGADEPPEAQGLNVLIVEDQEDARVMLSMLLEMDGHRVTAVACGTEALDEFAKGFPDIAFIDVGLPVMDGYALAREIRRRYSNLETFLVAHTGYGQPSDQAESAAAGFNAHLTKPLQREALNMVLAEIRKRKFGT